MRKTLEPLRQEAISNWQKLQNFDKPIIMVGAATCGRASGALDVMHAIGDKLKELDIEAIVRQVGCVGMCHSEVLVDIIKPGRPRITYANITPDLSKELVEDYLVHENAREDLAICVSDDTPEDDLQVRVVMRNCGHIDPNSITDYLAQDGYMGLAKALEMTPQEIIDEVKESGLRGRGGGGFPAGRKWESCLRVDADQKYVICNADEGDPGAFMDRSVLEGDPHSVIEGMAIAGYAIGATKGILYVRAEYPLAIRQLKIAIEQAKERNLLGKNILGSGFDFELDIFQGAGAFVCGESTALVLSIEGRRGMPKPLPRPRTSEEGLWGKPTLLNNVKTFACVAQIIHRGTDWFKSIGTENCPGTAVFALTGKINKSGLIEVPMGIQLEKIINDIGGGVAGGRAFKAVQTGGPSGGCLPPEMLNLPVDFDSLTAAGSMMGSGGMVVMDDTTCMVDVARYFLEFSLEESCGQCTPCRAGTEQMLTILNDISQGKGREGDIDLLVEMGEAIIDGSICGLGQSAPNPVLSTIRYFREEYEAHIRNKECPAKACKELITYTIDAEKCSACGRCLKACPSEAITGAKKTPHAIDAEKCDKCGICFTECPDRFAAIQITTGRTENSN
ncbi:NADH-quinone oxidoreductase subunit NuoF [Dethiobacter alkaliphilus]|uniref:NADH dehydrogenase (Quinone) n=1 Tax=Dethiobacter alkaliphilus AHT 1 TaxID=555088 RepID=C0GH60_DETAL|nr:NADH-quinone oxidoreductase subunit NuoF [Dethiobacter alkaliphilus]EEG77362.1 NADH dehydrogenase (quinone) [Dethiobacter alkaliphilus AHT 1]